MMLRRLKEDVEKTLAAKEETIVEVELTNIQKKYYRAILERNFDFLAKGGSSSNLPNLMNTMMELRKCCNHPYLVNGLLSVFHLVALFIFILALCLVVVLPLWYYWSTDPEDVDSKCRMLLMISTGAEDQILEEQKREGGGIIDAEKLYQLMIQASGKLVLVDKLLPKLKADGHKVLIFSQMIRVLDIIEDYLVHKQ